MNEDMGVTLEDVHKNYWVSNFVAARRLEWGGVNVVDTSLMFDALGTPHAT